MYSFYLKLIFVHLILFFLYFEGIFDKTIIPLALVRYKIGATRLVGYLPSQIQRAFVGLLLNP